MGGFSIKNNARILYINKDFGSIWGRGLPFSVRYLETTCMKDGTLFHWRYDVKELVEKE